ncbi:MAG TPA: lipase family protein [Candidatus Acidoferrales bacterium]|nr:lipase family protein [Candidatus Acidoferrales bacterium]
MNPVGLYSAKKDDLYYPCRNVTFFPLGPPRSEAALCAEISRITYCQQEENFAFDRDRIQKALAPVQFTVRQFFESAGDPKHGGTHCCVAVREAGGGTDALAVVAFRGTNKDDLSDIVDDADILRVEWERGGKVHRGFAQALGEVRAGLEEARKSLACRILFTGHSLGAALATLLASAWKREAGNKDALISFGCPRVGDADFAATLEGMQNSRYVDCCDAVTRVPPEALGFRHFGPTLYINRKRHVRSNPGSVSIFEDRVIAKVEYFFEYAWKSGNVGVRDLADHAPINYVLAVGSSAG